MMEDVTFQTIHCSLHSKTNCTFLQANFCVSSSSWISLCKCGSVLF